MKEPETPGVVLSADEIPHVPTAPIRNIRTRNIMGEFVAIVPDVELTQL